MIVRVLALDPSSTCIGYALMADVNDLLEHGRIVPRRVKDQANDRLRVMLEDLLDLLRETRPDRVVIEDTGTKMHRNRAGGGAGMMVYGKAVGAVWAVCRFLGSAPVDLIEAAIWTLAKPKGLRQRELATQFRDYDPAADPAGDAADAIGLARYWLRRERLRRSKPCAQTNPPVKPARGRPATSAKAGTKGTKPARRPTSAASRAAKPSASGA